MVSSAMQKFLNLFRSHLFLLVFISFALWDRSKNILLWFLVECSVFSSGDFMVSGLTFRSLIHLEWFFSFLYGIRKCSHPVLSTTYWRECLFSTVYSCLLCCRLTDHRRMGLFLVSLFCSTDQWCGCFCARTMYFVYCRFIYICVVVWAFFGIAFLWDWKEHWPFPVLWPLLTAEFSKFAGILRAALSQHHLLEFEIAQLEFHHLH